MSARQTCINGRYRHLSGWQKDHADPRDKVMAPPFLGGLTLAASVSLKGSPGLIVEDQEDIGSCTCNSSTSALMFDMWKQNQTVVQLSRLWAYDKVREIEGTPLAEDSGAQIRDVVKVLATLGCPPEKLWPYDTTKLAVAPPDSLLVEAAKHKALLYYRCGTSTKPNLNTIKASLAQGFPVIGGFSVPANMETEACALTGIVKYPTKDEEMIGGHAVLFTGYNDQTKLLEFMNSWGTGWGKAGFGYLPYDFVLKGLADDFWTLRRAS